MLNRRILLTALPVLLLVAPTLASAQAVMDGYQGATALGLDLRRLGNTARVLHIGAHPDDENTALFAPLALGRGVDAAYLSLTRGEGGQNGIGPELGIALGVIRSEELLAARGLDGGTQFFSRAIDYGYSKNAEEAFRHWPRDTLLADVVEVIRRYRPDVVASVWSGTDRDGHGQHEASGIIAREAVLAAGDPTRFPEQIAAGLRPHTPALYYRSAWFSSGPPDVELNTGELDPLLGASYHQVAMASRSRHRSQDQGRPLDPGPRRTAFDRVDPDAPVTVAESRSFGRYGEGAADVTASLFEDVDTLLSQRAARVVSTAVGADRRALDRVVGQLQAYESLVAEARDSFDSFSPWALVPGLARAHDRLDGVARALDDRLVRDPVSATAVQHLRFHLSEEMEDVRRALIGAASVRVDVVASDALIIPGQTFELELAVWNGGPRPIRAEASPLLPRGWNAVPIEGTASLRVAPGDRTTVTYAVTVPADAELTTPYYLDTRGEWPDDLYRWPDDPAIRGLPFAPAPVRASFLVALGDAGDTVPLDREALWRGVDARDGEYRLPVKVVPAVSVRLDPAMAVIPLSDPERPIPFTVRLRSQHPGRLAGELRPVLPPGWTAEPRRIDVALEDEGEERTFSFAVSAPRGLEAGAYDVTVELVTPTGRYDLGYQDIDYPHISPHHVYRPAHARVSALDVEVANVRVGYVNGAGDGMPEALDQLGVAWEPLESAQLANGDLARFDVIITGIRAYEVRDDLVAHNQRLLDWARRGGTLIVQYNKYPALSRDYAPWPVTIARPHGRVTDETAPVRVLAPDHPVLTTPNSIGPADWDGWIQERGLYFWDTWDASLTPLLAMGDPGEEPLTGSLLVGPLGQGTYVYTALAFFRQLPEGVPGAYRLLANLISLGTRQ